MSLYPGAPRRQPDGSQALDGDGMKDSMALAIEQALDELSRAVNGSAMPDDGRDERRLLFTAIARGVLKYLGDHQGVLRAEVTVPGSNQPLVVSGFDLHVTMDESKP